VDFPVVMNERQILPLFFCIGFLHHLAEGL
jgi:hypothetical protein